MKSTEGQLPIVMTHESVEEEWGKIRQQYIVKEVYVDYVLP